MYLSAVALVTHMIGMGANLAHYGTISEIDWIYYRQHDKCLTGGLPRWPTPQSPPGPKLFPELWSWLFYFCSAYL